MAAAASTAAGLYGRLNRSSTRGFLAYVAACAACAAVLTCFVISSAEPSAAAPNGVPRLSSRSARVWPDLAFNWRVVVATVVGFLGSAFGTVGGVGGGGIFVPMLNLLVGFDTKSAAALSKCMIMGASASSVWYNLQVSHPTKEAPVIDYKLALLFQPMLMLGITIGVELSVIFPYWLITVLIIILFIGTSSRSFYKGILMWREETRILMETQEQEEQAKSACAASDVVLDPSYEEPLLPQPQPKEKSALETFLFNLRWKNILVLMAVWSSFLVLQVLKKNSKSCSTFYWVINILQVPVAVSVFLWEAVQLCRESRARRMNGNWECVCEASIEWSPTQLIFCAFCSLLGGTVGGLLGSGGGFILGPLLLELGCIPQAANNLCLEQLLRSRPALLPRLASIRQLELIIRRQWRCLVAAQKRETTLSLAFLCNVHKAEKALAAVERHMDNIADQVEATDSEEAYHGILFDNMGHANDLPRLEEQVERARTIFMVFENLAADPPTPKVEEETYET